LLSDPNRDRDLLGFIDDDPVKRDRRIQDLPVLGGHADLEKVLGSQRGDKKETGIRYDFKPIMVKNPLNIELNSMRMSLLPGLLKNLTYNVRHGNLDGSLFEIGPVFWVESRPDLQGERPFSEEGRVGILLWGEKKASWIKNNTAPLFFQLKGILENLLEQWGIRSSQFDALKTVPGFMHPGQSARVFVEGKPIGIMGTVHPGLLNSLEVSVPAAYAEINLETLFSGQPRVTKMKALPKYPSMSRDVAYLADKTLSAGDIRKELMKAAGSLATSCECFDVFEGKNVAPDKKSLAFRLVYLDPQKTLSDEEINALHKKSTDSVAQKLGLSVR
jgi:phenylalanyl-tRNA synthetase beta chain